MAVEWYLRQIGIIDMRIERNERRLKILREKNVSAKAINLSERVQTSLEDYTADRICDYIDQAKRIREENDSMRRAKETIIKQIDGLDRREYQDILYRVYAEGKNVSDAALEMHVSRTTAWKYHKEAVKAFESTYGSEMTEYLK